MRIYGGQHLIFQVVRERKGETGMVKIMSAVGEGDVKFTLVRVLAARRTNDTVI